MIPYLHFELVTAGNNLTDKPKMTYKSISEVQNIYKIILKWYKSKGNIFEVITARHYLTDNQKMTDKVWDEK